MYVENENINQNKIWARLSNSVYDKRKNVCIYVCIQTYHTNNCVCARAFFYGQNITIWIICHFQSEFRHVD